MALGKEGCGITGSTVIFTFPFFLLALAAGAALPQSAAPPKPKLKSTENQATAPRLIVAPDLAQRLAKFKPIHISFDSSGLTEREKKMVAKLVDAAGLLDSIYWRQSDPEGLKLYLSLLNSKNPQDQILREYLKINGAASI